MGACASKPNVLNGDAPEDALDNIVAKDVEVVVKEELVNKEDIVTVHDDDDVNHTSSVNNLLNNEEGKGSIEEKEETLVKSNEVACGDEEKYSEVQKIVDDGPKIDAVDDDKKIEHVKSQTPEEEVVKPSMESENKKDDQEKLPEKAPANNTIEEVKLAFEDNKIEDKLDVAEDLNSDAQKNKTYEKPAVAENLNSDAQKNKTHDKPVATKKGKFWWDK
ncbi:uncharacterized protein [Solanum tuberosum]|uniref:Uncharacterized serine-rich protein C215.13 n=1 Tax=Solanum tuberosum TaxID=4113 RepID=M1BHX2_SOLTU|nr:PREDICTED: uncharacterized protein LOC102596727 [Solanum tuberosum]